MRKRLLFTAAAALTALASLAGVTVGVTVQLLEDERDMLPDKTIEVVYKTLKYKDNAPAMLVSALDSVMSLTAENTSTWRTFLLTVNGTGTHITVENYDPNGATVDKKEILGTLRYKHCHFLVRCNDSNKDVINSLVHRSGEKINYVREFIFVPEKIAPTATAVEACINNGELVVTRQLIDSINLAVDDNQQ